MNDSVCVFVCVVRIVTMWVFLSVWEGDSYHVLYEVTHNTEVAEKYTRPC